MTSSLRKLTLLAAAAASLVSVSARADVMATSVVNVSNFTISATGGAQLTTANFSFLTFTSTGGYAGTLNGVSQFNASSTATPVDLPAVCAGAGCAGLGLVNNGFPHLAPPPVAGNYVAADQMETGAPIIGLPGLGSPAQVQNGAYVGLTTGTVAAHSEATNNLQSSFIFQLANPLAGITFAFSAEAYLQAYVTASEVAPGFATAAYQIEFSLINLSTNTSVATFSPDVFGNGIKTLSLNAPLPSNISLVQSGSNNYSFNSGVLNNTDLYQLSARVQTNTDAQRLAVVPEPGSLSLLGLALLGAGAATRRLRKEKTK